MSDTVKIHISIEIGSEADYDTELSVEDWNALTDQERSRIAREAWETEAGNGDHGGMGVLADGAVDV